MSGIHEVPLPLYRSHKLVRAAAITAVGDAAADGSRELLLNVPGRFPDAATFHGKAELFSRYVPMVGDYVVVYPDGYVSLSPRKAFEEGYVREG